MGMDHRPTLPVELLEVILDHLVVKRGEAAPGVPARQSLLRCALASRVLNHLAMARLYRDLQLSYSVDEGLASASWNGPSVQLVVKHRALVSTLRLVVGVRAYDSDAAKVDKALGYYIRNTFREEFNLQGLALDFGSWKPGPLALAAVKERLAPKLRRLSIIQLLGATSLPSLLQGCPNLEELVIRKLRECASITTGPRLHRLRVESDETREDAPFEALTFSTSTSLLELTLTIRHFAPSPLYPLHSFAALRSLTLRPSSISDAHWTTFLSAASNLSLPSLETLSLASPYTFATLFRARALTTARLFHHLPPTLRTLELSLVPIELDYLLAFLDGEDGRGGAWGGEGGG
ncbi:hypothetical protein RQP46_001006 [Phenoliferia psychrophenolica]